MLSRATAAAACTAAVIGSVAAAPASAHEPPFVHDLQVTIGSETETGWVRTVFDAGRVVLSDGPELTAEDLEGPASHCGAVEVDIDHERRTITVTSTEPGCTADVVSMGIDSAVLWHAGLEVATNQLVSWEPETAGRFDFVHGFATAEPIVTMRWVADEAGTMTLSGQTVVTYGATPFWDATQTPAPAPTAAPAPAPAAPAKPVVANPTFTG